MRGDGHADPRRRYDPVYAGDLGSARAVEDFLGVIFAVSGRRGPFFYRIY